MSANNIQIELDAVVAIGERLQGAMDANNLASIKPDPYNPLFQFSIAMDLQGTLPKAEKTGDSKGRTIAKLTKGTIPIEKDGDQQGQAAAAGLNLENFLKIGETNLGVKSSSTDINNKGTDLYVKTEDDANDFDQIMSDLDYQSYIKMMTALSSMEKEELQRYLTEVPMAEDMKAWLLASPKIDADLREIIFEMEPTVIQAGLKNILENQNVADDLTQDIIYEFSKQNLESFKSMTPEDTQNIIESAENMITGSNLQEKLTMMYNGDTVGTADLTRDFFNTVVNTISKETEISPMDLLNRKEYAEPLTDCISNVTKTMSQTAASSKYSGNSVGDLLMNLTKGV